MGDDPQHERGRAFGIHPRPDARGTRYRQLKNFQFAHREKTMPKISIDTKSFIAIVLVLAVIGLTFGLALKRAPDSDIFKMMPGALMTVGFATIIGFYFGSSQGSKDKDDAISHIAMSGVNGAPKPPAPPQQP